MHERRSGANFQSLPTQFFFPREFYSLVENPWLQSMTFADTFTIHKVGQVQNFSVTLVTVRCEQVSKVKHWNDETLAGEKNQLTILTAHRLLWSLLHTQNTAHMLHSAKIFLWDLEGADSVPTQGMPLHFTQTLKYAMTSLPCNLISLQHISTTCIYKYTLNNTTIKTHFWNIFRFVIRFTSLNSTIFIGIWGIFRFLKFFQGFFAIFGLFLLINWAIFWDFLKTFGEVSDDFQNNSPRTKAHRFWSELTFY